MVDRYNRSKIIPSGEFIGQGFRKPRAVNDVKNPLHYLLSDWAVLIYFLKIPMELRYSDIYQNVFTELNISNIAAMFLHPIPMMDTFTISSIHHNHGIIHAR